MKYTAAQLMILSEADWEMRRRKRSPEQGHVNQFKLLHDRVRAGDGSATILMRALSALGHTKAKQVFPKAARQYNQVIQHGNLFQELLQAVLSHANLTDKQIAQFALDCAWWASEAFWTVWPKPGEEEEEEDIEKVENDPDAPLWHQLMLQQEEEEEEEEEEPDWRNPAVVFSEYLKNLENKNYFKVIQATEVVSDRIYQANNLDPWYGTTGPLPDLGADHYALYACAFAARAARNVGGGMTDYYIGNNHVVKPKKEEMMESAATAAYYASEAHGDQQWVLMRLFRELGL